MLNQIEKNKQTLGYRFNKDGAVLFKLFISYSGTVTLEYAESIASMINLLWKVNSTIDNLEKEIKRLEFNNLKIWLERS